MLNILYNEAVKSLLLPGTWVIFFILQTIDFLGCLAHGQPGRAFWMLLSMILCATVYLIAKVTRK